MASSGEDGDIWDPRGKTVCYETTKSQGQNVCSSNTSTEKECNDCGRASAQSVVATSFYAAKDVEREELEDNKDDIRMLIAGKRGVGKSSLANSIAGKHMQESKSNHETVTQISAELKCKRQEMSLIYFDTPGLSFDGDEKRAQNEYKKCLIRAAPGLHTILIVQKATEYTSSNQAFLDTCTKIFGENCWKYVIFVFTHIDELKRDLKDQIEDADESLKRYLSKCGNRYVEINNNLKETRNDQQIKILLSTVKDLMKTNNGEIYTNEEFQEIYKRMQNAARDGNLTLSEVREKILNTMASKEVITGVWKGFIRECFNMHV